VFELLDETSGKPGARFLGRVHQEIDVASFRGFSMHDRAKDPNISRAMFFSNPENRLSFFSQEIFGWVSFSLFRSDHDDPPLFKTQAGLPGGF
jgi:hypothetical protein